MWLIYKKERCNRLKQIQELQQIKGDAYDYYISGSKDTELFEKIFLVDEIIDEICKPDKYFLVGEKGSGKTAYSVYMSKKCCNNCFGSISLVENTLYHRFINMKSQKALEISSYKDIWINLIYLILAENIRKEYGDEIFGSIKYKQLSKAISSFYSDAFKPEFINAFEFIDNSTASINTMIEQGVYSVGAKNQKASSQKYIEQSYQVSLLKIRDGFEKAFQQLKLKRTTILFVDGIDARPRDIDNAQYFDCLTGLVNAVLEMNQSFLKERNIKIMLLVRPDILYKMPVHNMNQKLRNNSVLLNWVTTYKKYVESKLFRIADDYFMKQQDKEYELGVCWNNYFPYQIPDKRRFSRGKDNPFIEFLRYSLYKPRDILTMLNEMVDATDGKSFTHDDFDDMLSNYSTYLKGELKDYMLIYMDDSDYSNFILFFDYFQGCKQFDYKTFEEKHLVYVKYLKELGRKVPPYMETASEALQLLYDTNIICYKTVEKNANGDKLTKMFWSYKERNYANIQPEVKKNGYYAFHLAYARAFRL